MRSSLCSAVRFAVALVVAASLVPLAAGAARADTAPPAGTPATVSADALPTWQVNGVVWKLAVVGNTVYAGGSFTKARPPGVSAGGTGEVAAQNLFAYNVTTGNRVSSFSHRANGQVLTVQPSPDHSRVYVGGDFTQVDGLSRNHIAAFDAATGALISGFKPSLNGSVRAIAVAGSTVYAGGMFTSAGGSARERLAAFNASNGSLTGWAPSADDGRVQALVASPLGGKVVVGGRFSTLNGVLARGTGAVSSSTGTTMQWLGNQKIISGRDSQCGTTSLSTDGTKVYGSAFAFGCGNFEGVWAADPATGALVFANDCHGDTYDTFPIGGVVYSVSHAHDCRWMGGFLEGIPSGVNMRRTLAFTSYATHTNTGPDSYGWDYRGYGASDLLQWYPDLQSGNLTGQGQAAWTVSGNGSYVVLGGEFPAVNGKKQQGLTRFAVRSLATNQRGPTRKANAPATTAVRQSNGSVKVTWQSAFDMDNANLTYDVLRSGTTQRVGSLTGLSSYWNLPLRTFFDQGAVGTHTYTVRATDPTGNVLTFPATGSVATAGTLAKTGPLLVGSDDFGRTAARSWGQADTGGAWTSSPSSAFKVGGGVGTMTLPSAGSTRSAMLRSISTSGSDTRVTVISRQAATGAGTSATVIARRVGPASYRGTLVFRSNGRVRLDVSKVVGATTTRMTARTIAGVSYRPGDKLLLRVQAVGTSPTTVGARVWKVGQTEPTGWQVSATDSTAGLQAAGSVGLSGFLSGSSAATPVTLAYDGLRVNVTNR
jgi:Rax2 C-terminal beta propeller domain